MTAIRYFQIVFEMKTVISGAVIGALLCPTAVLSNEATKEAKELPSLKIQARASTQRQASGTPNISSAGLFAPIRLSRNWIGFLDAEVGLNYPDRSDYSSIINTTIGGYTLSTSAG